MWAQQCGKRGLDTTPVGSGSRRGAGGRQGLAGQRVDAPSEARGADGSRAGRHPPAHTATRHHRCGGRRRDRRARAGFETTHRDTHQHASRRRCGGRRRDPWAWLRCPWAVAGPGRHHTAPKAPPAWRAPEGPVGLTAVPVGGGGAWPGFETTRRAEGSRRGRLAGGPPPTGTPSSPAQQHTTRRPERQRRHKKHSTGARAHRPAPLDATTQTRQLRSTCVPYRSARAARRWRRSSRSPRLRRRAGPRR